MTKSLRPTAAIRYAPLGFNGSQRPSCRGDLLGGSEPVELALVIAQEEHRQVRSRPYASQRLLRSDAPWFARVEAVFFRART